MDLVRFRRWWHGHCENRLRSFIPLICNSPILCVIFSTSVLMLGLQSNGLFACFPGQGPGHCSFNRCTNSNGVRGVSKAHIEFLRTSQPSLLPAGAECKPIAQGWPVKSLHSVCILLWTIFLLYGELPSRRWRRRFCRIVRAFFVSLLQSYWYFFLFLL